MPKQVDHDARRAEIAAALGRVVLRDGVDAASVRVVAAEAGWSAGALRHYFPDQAALLRFAVTGLLEQVPPRVEARLAAPPDLDDPVARLRGAQALLEEVLPLDEARRFEMHVWLATMDRARHDAGLDEARVLMWDAIRSVCRVALSWSEGRPAPVAPDEARAAVLHALVDGLAVQAFHYPERLPPEALRAVLEAYLTSLRDAGGAGRPAV